MEFIVAATSILSSVFAGISVLYLAKQIKESHRTAKVQFISNLESEFMMFANTYIKLLPGGIWCSEKDGPNDSADVQEIINYLAFFLKIEYLLNQGLLDIATVDKLFATRFFLVANNIHTQRKILYEEMYKSSWADIFSLYHKWSKFRNGKVPFDTHNLDSKQPIL